MRRRLFALGIGLLILLWAFTGRSLAHATLVEATPQPGTTLAEPPEEIYLFFNERLSGGTIEIFGANFEEFLSEPVEATGEYSRELRTPCPSLPDGTYTVNWKAISRDGHEISGSFQFGVRTATQTTGVPWLPLLGGGAAVVLLGGALFLWRARTDEHRITDRL